MFEEVRMMKFKIKPIQGDVSAFNLKNERFIESLWSLGKLDEFFHKEFPEQFYCQNSGVFQARITKMGGLMIENKDAKEFKDFRDKTKEDKNKDFSSNKDKENDSWDVIPAFLRRNK